MLPRAIVQIITIIETTEIEIETGTGTDTPHRATVPIPMVIAARRMIGSVGRYEQILVADKSV